MNDLVLQNAWRLHQAGNLGEAARLYNQVLQSNPQNFDALQMLGFLHFQRGEFKDAERIMERALKLNPNSLDALYNRGCALQALERLPEALQCFDRTLAIKPDLAPALMNRGNTLSQMGRYEDAILSYDILLTLAPTTAEAHLNRGNALFELKRPAEALTSYDKAATLEPRDPLAWNNRGNALAALSRYEDAAASFGKVLALVSGDPAALEGRGNAYLALERDQDALADFDRALLAEPDAPSILHARGRALAKLNRQQGALAAFDKVLALDPGRSDVLVDKGITLIALDRAGDAVIAFENALRIAPGDTAAVANRASAFIALKRYAEALADADTVIGADDTHAEAWHNRASALAGLRRFADALASYDRALTVRPGNATSWTNRGNASIGLKRFENALADFDRALSIVPNAIEALSGRANALYNLKRFADAIADCDAILRIDPGHAAASSLSIRCRLHACDWRGLENERRRVAAGLDTGRPTVSPLDAKAIFDSEETNFKAAKLWMTAECPPSPVPLWRGGIYRHDKIRVAYLSSDLRTHAVASLIAGAFEHHDKTRFETIAVSFGPDDGGETRARIVAAFDRFIDARGKNDAEVASLLREMEIDIAVDLNGYTGEARTPILAARPAPIQVNYLGFPGTMAAGYMDYILADRIVAPEANAAQYSEKIVYLPNSYQANDSKRHVSSRIFTRAEAGLPERGFVFCSFNNSYKITPEIFDIWMRLLRETEASVLWLLHDSPTAAENLQREAGARGIDPARLIFAPRLKPEDHLARQRLADLFLDTSPYNAHTTASDALWMGLPLLTCSGHTFSGRVAASLLNAAGLPELIAGSWADYEAMALKFAHEPEALASIKKKLAQNRDGCALFDTACFTRHLEAAYIGMVERHRRGEGPASFAVAP